MTLEEELQIVIDSYKERYSSPESLLALQKTFQSHNITIEDWNSLVNFVNSHTNTLTIDEILKFLEDVVSNFDTKVTKIKDRDIDSDFSKKVYVTDASGEDSKLGYSSDITYSIGPNFAQYINERNHIVQRTNDGSILVPPPSGTSTLQAVNKLYVDDALVNKEDNSNKVTAISDGSTDTEYPSAKAVWNNLQDVREVAEGKSKTIVISYNETNPLTLQNDFPENTYKKPDGTYLNTWDDFISYTVPADDTGRFLNADFNSPNNSVDCTGGYFVTADKEIFLADSDFKKGDIIIVIEVEVPDRWLALGNPNYAYKLETTNVNLTDVVTLNTNQTITGIKTFERGIEFNQDSSIIGPDSGELEITAGNANYIFDGSALIPSIGVDLGSSSYKWNNLYLSGAAKIGDWSISDTLNGSNHVFYIQQISQNTGLKFERDKLYPHTTNYTSLGTSENQFKDLYLGGSINFPNTQVIKLDTDNQLAIYSGSTRILKTAPSGIFVSAKLVPNSNNSIDIGRDTVRFKDLYLAGNISDGTNSASVANVIAAANNSGGSPVAYEGISALPTDVVFSDWTLHRAIKDGNTLWLVCAGKIVNNSGSTQYISQLFDFTLPYTITSKIYRDDGSTCNNNIISSQIILSGVGTVDSSAVTFSINSPTANYINVKLYNSKSLSAGASIRVDLRIPIFLDIGTTSQ